jgi:hypothetical protein
METKEDLYQPQLESTLRSDLIIYRTPNTLEASVVDFSGILVLNYSVSVSPSIPFREALSLMADHSGILHYQYRKTLLLSFCQDFILVPETETELSLNRFFQQGPSGLRPWGLRRNKTTFGNLDLAWAENLTFFADADRFFADPIQTHAVTPLIKRLQDMTDKNEVTVSLFLGNGVAALAWLKDGKLQVPCILSWKNAEELIKLLKSVTQGNYPVSFLVTSLIPIPEELKLMQGYQENSAIYSV